MTRTRYAPSPTGELHLGGLRTALYAWLHARHNGGKFYIRIEDTDRARFVPGSAERMLEQLHACGIDWDEGPDIGGPHAPYVQSERLTQYRAAIQQLLEQGSAYRCDCSPKRLTALRDAQAAAKQPPRYDGHCRTRTDVPEQAIGPSNDGRSVVRFRIPDDAAHLAVFDRIHGEIRVDPKTLDDFVLLKSDGFPTYHLAHVVDDHAMETTTVIRGDEWLPSLPKHHLLFEAFGWDVPEYAHLPLLLGKSGKKLSKRDGDTSIVSFLQWCLPDALVNFVALLGWNPGGEREVYSREDLVDAFDIARVHSSPAIVNFEKLEWMNGEYIRAMDPDVLLRHCESAKQSHTDQNIVAGEIASSRTPRNDDKDFLLRAVELEQPRLKRLDAFPQWYFQAWKQDAPLAWKGSDVATAKDRLRAVHSHLTELDPWPDTPEAMEADIKSWITAQTYGVGETLWPMRVALSGQQASPSPFELAWCFGKEETLRRITNAIEHGV